MASFCTAINCMDGRVQLPVIEYLKRHRGVSYVDIVSEAGPALILARQEKPELVNSIMRRVGVSIDVHKSKTVAVVAHHDCAGIPEPEAQQHDYLRSAVRYVAQQRPNAAVIGLWVNDAWVVSEVC